MNFYYMAAQSLSIDEIRPLNRWANSFISPGAVGSVGDCLIQSRLKQNTPDSPMRWQYGTVGKDSILKGTNLQDGMKLNIATMGGPAKTIDSNWGGRREFKTRVGWIYQDLRQVDKSVIPIMGNTPNYSWNNKIATTYKATISGDKFLPMPGGYSAAPGTMLRGGNYPTATNEEEFSNPPTDMGTRGGLPMGTLLNPQTQPTAFGYSGEALERPMIQRAGLGFEKR